MRCAVGLSTTRNSDTALAEVLNRLGSRPKDDPDDIALVFSSMHHADRLGSIAQALIEAGLGQQIIGCTGESIIGETTEVEGTAALSVWTGRFPGATVQPFVLQGGVGSELPLFVGEPERTMLVLADPFTFPVDRWFKSLAQQKSKLRVIGGMASGSHAPGQNRLVLNGQVLQAGAVGLLIDGPVAIDACVSQGCRPIGRPFIVTKTEANVIRELGRRPAIEVLRELFEELSPEDQERVQAGLHLGVVISEYQETFNRGDFLVRNVMGVDDSGGIAVTDLARVGQTVQFHVRDAETADEDLETMLATLARAHPGRTPAGALLFSCNGRGSRLFDQPNHDVSAIHQAFGPIPCAGFFAMGELGPVGGQNFVHGYTASAVFFSEKKTD